MVFLSWIMSSQIQMEQSEELDTRIRDNSVGSTACVQELPPVQIGKSAIFSLMGLRTFLNSFVIMGRQRILEVQVGEQSVTLGEEQEVHSDHLVTVLASLLHRTFPDTPPHCACPRFSLNLFSVRSDVQTSLPLPRRVRGGWRKQSPASPSAV